MLLDSIEFFSLLLGFSGFQLVPIGFCRVELAFTQFYWILRGDNGFYWAVHILTSFIMDFRG